MDLLPSFSCCQFQLHAPWSVLRFFSSACSGSAWKLTDLRMFSHFLPLRRGSTGGWVCAHHHIFRGCRIFQWFRAVWKAKYLYVFPDFACVGHRCIWRGCRTIRVVLSKTILNRKATCFKYLQISDLLTNVSVYCTHFWSFTTVTLSVVIGNTPETIFVFSCWWETFSDWQIQSRGPCDTDPWKPNLCLSCWKLNSACISRSGGLTHAPPIPLSTAERAKGNSQRINQAIRWSVKAREIKASLS